MPQTQKYPEGFEPDAKYPVGFEPDVAPTPTTPVSHGASGSWTPEQQDVLANAHPAVRWLVEAPARFGKSAVDTAKDIVSSTKQTLDPRLSPEEAPINMVAGPTGVITHRLISKPTIANAQAWWQNIKDEAASGSKYEWSDPGKLMEASANALGMIPLIGPAIKSVLDTTRTEGLPAGAGSAASMFLTGEATKAGVEGTLNKMGQMGEYLEGKRTYAQNTPFLKTPSGHLRTALPSVALDDAGLETAGQMLKAGEKKIGRPVKDIDSAKDAAKAQFEQELMPQRRDIINKQRDVEVQGSAKALIDAKMDVLDKQKDTMTPAEYNRAAQHIKDMHPKDLTIGELEQLNTNLNASNRAYHQAKLGVALSKEQSLSAAQDIAAEPVTRGLMEYGMEAQGAGGAGALKAVNNRIGSLIKLEDAISDSENTARVQASESRLGRLLGRTRIYEGGTGKLSARAMLESKATVNEGIANAMRTWKSEAPPVKFTPRSRLGPAEGSPIRLGPAPDTSGPIKTPLKVTNRLNAAPDTSAVTSPPVVNAPFPRAQIPAKTGGPHAMPEVPTEPTHTAGPVIQQMEGPFKGKPITGEQQDLGGLPKRVVIGERQPANPQQGQLFTERQSTPAQIAGQQARSIPEGSTLSFKSKDLQGNQLYHYQTPDGEMLTSDKELDLDAGGKVKAKQFSGYRLSRPPMRRSKALK